MICEHCGKKKATVFYRETMNGHSRALHLCTDCAEAMEKAGELEDMSAAFPLLQSPLTAAGPRNLLPLPAPEAPPTESTCPVCGLTADEAIHKGQLGCAACYEHLQICLPPLIGSIPYRGRKPRGFRERDERRQKLSELEIRLREAVQTERYESAAQLRDQIRELSAHV